MAPSCAASGQLEQLATLGERTGAASALRVLALQLKRIGDLILTAPALCALRQQYPAAHITLVTAEGPSGLLPAMNYVDRALVFRRGRWNPGLWGELVSESFDVCLDFTSTDRSALCCGLSRARDRVGFAAVRKSPWRPLAYNRFVDSPVREKHTIDHYLDLLGPLDIDVQGIGIPLHLPEEAFRSAKSALAAAAVPETFALVHPGAARQEKLWPAERWAEVIRQLSSHFPCVLTGGRATFEQEHLRRIQAALRVPVADLSGKLDLLTLAALTHQAQIVLSVDTGPMHLAAAFRTRQVALFGTTNPYHWRPRHENAAVLMAGREGVMTEFQPRDRGEPMAALSTGQVIRAMENLIAADKRL
jgi:ADP-heptose:LPS heptosyltransferase